MQTGITSPSKLRMKLIGSQKKKDGSYSSRTSPSRHEDSEFVNSLLADFGEEASSIEVQPIKYDDSNRHGLYSTPVARENGETGHVRMQVLVSKTDDTNSSTVVFPVRTSEEETLDYDSTSSFEFHKGERSLRHSAARSFPRPMPSKWNDAEKWIMNKQNLKSNVTEKVNLNHQANRGSGIAGNMVRVVPESAASENKPSIDFCLPVGLGKFAYASHGAAPASGQAELKDLTGEGTTGIRSVSMRDMGTEMTPIPSQEPSRSATPVGATTPLLRSPNSSIPSTPRRGEPQPTGHATQTLADYKKDNLSDKEMKLKTRRDIVALGVQLGKMNIAAWATDEDKAKDVSDSNEFERIEYAKRAAAWEEAEKSKHAARFKREEIKIQAWESRQKAKLDAEMRKIEYQIEQMKAVAQAKMLKKVALSRQKSEEMRNRAEARRNCQAEKTTAQADDIRQTGRIPSSPFICCGWP
ncbi:hypothetical protein F511_01825 [Dorcoceras hygrometricum]|uniref:Remorin C-terminal domain-containing protein n=1 Tax=Dorcoceras hygrometricum TaxID=472368 RepID=A0A2Z7CW57_9LAMI|nr:hypothetical protein F511_01825 [Dorcoceras hygrometricum]